MALPAIDTPSRKLVLAAKAEPILKKAFLDGVLRARKFLSIEILVDVLEHGIITKAVGDSLSDLLDGSIDEGILHLVDGVAVTFVAAGSAGAEFIGDALSITVGFDQTNVRAVDIMRSSRLRFIREFTAEQRAATRDALADGIERGLNPRDQARNLRASIGLTANQREAVANYRRLLEQGSTDALRRELRDRRFDSTVRRSIKTGDPLTKSQIDRMVSRYNDRYINYRAETIARTEALGAVHTGTEEAYAQAIEEGKLDVEQLVRTWITHLDSKTRSSHISLNGTKRSFGETFPGSNGPLRFPHDPRAPASEIVNCRCSLSTRIKNL